MKHGHNYNMLNCLFRSFIHFPTVFQSMSTERRETEPTGLVVPPGLCSGMRTYLDTSKTKLFRTSDAFHGHVCCVFKTHFLHCSSSLLALKGVERDTWVTGAYPSHYSAKWGYSRDRFIVCVLTHVVS